MHEVAGPFTVVASPIGPLVDTVTLHFVHNEVSNESARVVPEELTRTVLLSIDEGTLKESSIRQYHFSLTVLLVILPRAIIDGAIWFNHATQTILHITDPLALVVGTGWIGRENSKSLPHFSPEKRRISEVIYRPLSLVYSDLVTAMHPDHSLGPLESRGSILEYALHCRILFVIKSKLVSNSRNRTIGVSFVLGRLGVFYSLDIFPVEVALAEALN